jgi:hypothetical protein
MPESTTLMETAIGMPKPGFTPHMSPRTIGALIHEFAEFEPAKASREYPWATRFVMGLPLAPWQREFKWTEEQCRRFISSIWTGVHLGTYVVTDLETRAETDGFRGVEYAFLSNCVIDGQQRLMALELYVSDRLAVPDAAGAPTLWSEVGMRDRRRFTNTVFSRGTIRDQDEQRLRELHDLMNFAGTPHEEHERAVAEAPGQDCLAEDADRAAGDRPRGT